MIGKYTLISIGCKKNTIYFLNSSLFEDFCTFICCRSCRYYIIDQYNIFWYLHMFLYRKDILPIFYSFSFWEFRLFPPIKFSYNKLSCWYSSDFWEFFCNDSHMIIGTKYILYPMHWYRHYNPFITMGKMRK